MVIPRSRSSGALSIESNDRNCTLGFCLDSTLVMAAVTVVLPWSVCPIVPLFTCGLVRSNFSLATFQIDSSACPLQKLVSSAASLHRPAGGAGPHFLGNRGGCFLIMREVHGEAGAALGAAAQVGGVTKH